MARKRTLRIQFVMNRNAKNTEVKNKKHVAELAQTVVTDVGIAYAKGKFEELKLTARISIERGVRTELRHLEMQYKQFILGKERRPHGTITTALKTESKSGILSASKSASLSNVLPRWGDRHKDYLARKQREKGHTKWFEHSSYLGQAMNQEAWQEMFGPLHVTVKPIKSRPSSEGAFTDSLSFRAKGAKMRFGVATIFARVFDRLTPSMLPALASENMNDALKVKNGRTSGLLGLVAAKDEDAARHLGQNASHGRPYRPTLEPFLSFAITQSLPTAVMARLARDGVTLKKK